MITGDFGNDISKGSQVDVIAKVGFFSLGYKVALAF